MIAKALPNDDVIAECEDEVAVVHLTWTQKQERPPWPLTTFMASADEFESHVASEYLRPAAVQPSVAEMVPEPVRVHRDPGLPPPPGDDLVDAAGGQRPPVVPAGAKGRVGGKAFDQMAGELKA